MSDHDVIVLGVGGIGSAATYHLARKGIDVLGLERFDIPHEMGSSHGATRLFTLTKPRGPSYVPIAERALELWQDLDSERDEQLFGRTGAVRSWPTDDGGHRGSFEAARTACEEHSIPYEVLSGTELNERFPAFDLPADHEAIFQPDGGFLDPEACITAHVTAAQEHGATVRARESVLDWQPTEDGVEVRTEKDEYEADRLVVTAGAWASEMIEELDGLAVPERRVLAWLQPKEPELYRPDSFPIFAIDVEEGFFYGSPIHRVPGFKFGRRPRIREQVDPDTMPRETNRQDEEILRSFADRYFPSGAGPTMRMAACIVTMSPDEGFIIDTHPAHPQVSFAAGLSGSGFQVSSAVGELLGDMATDETPAVDPEIFGLDRF
jgi:sarcosine oxidase